MIVTGIMYHDVVEAERWETSGFAGSGADIYKLDRRVFEEHLAELAKNKIKPGTVFDVEKNESKVLITFDDGGESAYTDAADLLEKYGWHGHFFVATDFIGTAAFLKKDQIRKLHERGHIIGSHSASHPTRMSNCTTEQLLYEWRESIAKLSEIIGEKVTVASVPGGYFSKEVAKTAAKCGIKFLFNSEPVSKVYKVDDCQVFGRFTIRQKTSLQQLSELSKGNPVYKFRQYALWNSKKLAKKLGGKIYLDARKKFFES
jgi:peptidoglycan/xylan/chitin deacetylase (PgdA/CDA1 family)